MIKIGPSSRSDPMTLSHLILRESSALSAGSNHTTSGMKTVTSGWGRSCTSVMIYPRIRPALSSCSLTKSINSFSSPFVAIKTGTALNCLCRTKCLNTQAISFPFRLHTFSYLSSAFFPLASRCRSASPTPVPLTWRA